MSDRYIILRTDKPPEFVGAWKIGEVLALLEALRHWLENIPLSTEQDT